MKYKIVVDERIYALERTVDEWIQLGWKALGGVSYNGAGGLVQAMILPDDPKPCDCKACERPCTDDPVFFCYKNHHQTCDYSYRCSVQCSDCKENIKIYDPAFYCRHTVSGYTCMKQCESCKVPETYNPELYCKMEGREFWGYPDACKEQCGWCVTSQKFVEDSKDETPSLTNLNFGAENLGGGYGADGLYRKHFEHKDDFYTVTWTAYKISPNHAYTIEKRETHPLTYPPYETLRNKGKMIKVYNSEVIGSAWRIFLYRGIYFKANLYISDDKNVHWNIYAIDYKEGE